MNVRSRLVRIAVLLSLLTVAGCVSRQPTIAHVHIGHAVTDVVVTHNNEVYFVTAERRAHETYDLAQRAAGDADLAAIKQDTAAAVSATTADEEFGVKHAVVMAANHISFAATSDD